jgi:hypothetical protein
MSQDFANVVSFQSFPKLPNNNEYIVFDQVDTPDFSLNGTKLVCNNAGTWNFIAQYQLVSYISSTDKALTQVDGWIRVNGVNIENSDATNSVNNVGGVNVLCIGFVVELKLNDTVEWGIRTSQYSLENKVLCGIESYLARSGITAPSIILTINKVKAVTQGFKNYANISSNMNFPVHPNNNEYISFTNSDTNDFTLNGSKLICNNAGTWSLTAQYQCYSYRTTDLGANSEVDGWIRVNGVNIENSDATWSSTLLNELGVLTIGTVVVLKQGDSVEFGIRSSSLDNKINNGIINYVTPTGLTAPSIILTGFKVNSLLNGFANYANVISLVDLPTKPNKNELVVISSQDTNDFSVDGTKLIVKNPGKWLVLNQYQLYSYQKQLSGADGFLDGWFRANGVNIPNSDATTSSSVLSGVNVLPIAFALNAQLGDVLEFGIRCSSQNNEVSSGMKQYIAQTNIRAPSTIITLLKI